MRVEDRDVLQSVVVWLVTMLLAILAFVMVLRWARPDETIPVRTWGGVTWAGDQCHVVEDLEVLVCRGGVA